ncbi:MAG: pyridoxal 5'-phosphate synthase glutaminase subunit PdxT [Bacteroidales bacterium]|nr:pyridoxal 5'-phosphate synthase glutaminase subunit PdxT [Bacteroidales bacterium]MDY2935192.1 pyridoxal 5'-phosphate synthase glutaminase subunit PdxT [Candidatus Cryptobacteroides sp.]
MGKRIAVLSLQGAFAEHEKMLGEVGIACFEVRQRKDWDQPKDGLIIPGGESTTQSKLLVDLGLIDPIKDEIIGGLPVFGTCAGLILLAKNMEGEPFKRLSTMNISVRRNAYGRQLGSFHARGSFAGQDIPMTFIRAPYIESVGAGVEVLSVVDGHIVAAREGNQLVTAFHPELDDCQVVYEYFARMFG